MHIRRRTNIAKGSIMVAAFMLATMASAVAGATDEKKAMHPAVAVPATIDFGSHAAKTEVPGRVWLINRDDQPLMLTKIKGSCGCIKLTDNKPVEIAPHAALPIEFTYQAAPKDGTSKTKKLQFIFENQDSLSVELNIATDNQVTTELEKLPSLDNASVLAAPGVVVFGEVKAGSQVKSSVWLINASDAPRHVESVKGDCGCITVKNFIPLTLVPREARLVQFSVKTPAKHGKDKNTKITFHLTDGEPLTLPISMHTAEEHVARSVASQD